MATKQEIITAIRQGIERVEQTFSGLSDAELDKPVHAGEGGWTARQILAHLAGRADSYQMMFQLAEAPPQQQGAPSFDVNHWNQGIVDARVGKSRDDLLAEFRETHESLIQRVEALPDETLQQTVTMPRGPVTVGDALLGSGGQHSISHAEEVEQALGTPGS